ncbi:MAG: M23 family metallopeptidase [Rickettsiales bacterium]|jgi:murein DD-endopeptidase MepM/ murein hydrolase activator NlpD|nr:M23 family metallopeptidase [Rickettsiales bacterium]
MGKFVEKFYKDFITEKEIIVVSPTGIKRRKVGKLQKVSKYMFIGWVAFSSVFVFLNSKIIRKQNLKINELKGINYDLNENIGNLNIVVSNLKDYLSSLNYYDRFNKIDIRKVSDEKSFVKNRDLLSSIEYKKVLPVINVLDKNIDVLNTSIDSRIEGINSVLSESPVLKNKAEQIYKVRYKKNFEDDRMSSLENIFSNTSVLIKKNDITDIKDKVKYLSFLEEFLNSAPITEPMNNYFLTSKYGSRIDPFTGEVKSHKGLDFAGSYNSTVFSTAGGTVEFSGRNGGFGNVIIINHGNKIRTAYAHLKEPLVKVGQKISRKEAIGIQGNSGRATGQHLHYEITVDNKTVDPMKFVNIGKKVY